MPDKHALLSASSAHRWLNCTPAPMLEAQFPDAGSPYAEEGTTAHALAELMLSYNNGDITKRIYNQRLKKIQESPYYNAEMQTYIEDYARLVWEAVNEVKKTCEDPQVLFEQRLDFSEYVPSGFGTGDVVIIADGLLQIIDLKYGKGVPVSAVGNPQLRLYGLGAYLGYSLLYDITRVRMTIIQPRLDNYSTEEMPVDDLIDWAEKVVRPAAQLAIKGEGEAKAGDWCRFCKARETCRKRAEHNLELVKYEFSDPMLLEPHEIADILSRIPELTSWAKDVSDYALRAALDGEHFEGWKIVEGISRRQITDMKAAAEALMAAGFGSDAIYKPTELKGITDLTKLVGKKQFDELLGKYVEKPEGKPVLVPETDKRPEFNSKESLKEEF